MLRLSRGALEMFETTQQQLLARLQLVASRRSPFGATPKICPSIGNRVISKTPPVRLRLRRLDSAHIYKLSRGTIPIGFSPVFGPDEFVIALEILFG